MEQLTFLLAFLGYVGLGYTAVRVTGGKSSGWLWKATVLVIVVHVTLVWAVRYDWQIAVATRNGYVGFLLFHVALIFIVASIFVPAATGRWLIWFAFVVVSVGAIAAVFRYDVVEPYRLPVIGVAAMSGGGLLYVLLRRWPRIHSPD